ncbi:PAS domain-containing protein [Sporosarcina thermotolerans]|uniref:PAS domain-containing protein n=1 Tax=Sporosarcina thermotolerans TaxID=633404 RepID=A0AAW9AEM9_9BACL|nr:PAS domain-containing protein [Sporosarcina thermotolerans]MDW0117536.1 PAS domain-containing protein [Sporosarcina thermotolerans]
MNSLPLEITFIDKQGLFKYFNEMTEASEMMLVRTPSSIGRHVANCHPPKSLRKVMTVIRDLKTGIRTSESMWFKKKDQYIHLTYKAIFNKEGEFLGVLEYVQDIQHFFELPSKVKTGLSEIDFE